MNLSMFKIDFRLLKKIDKALFISMISLIVFGILNIYLCTKAEYGTYFLIRQTMWLCISIVALYVTIAVDYTILKGYTDLFYWGSVILLVLLLFMGSTINGATGWFRLGPLSFQPAELAKVATMMKLGMVLESMDGSINEWKNFWKMGIYAIIPAALIVIQPDMGMTMVLFFIVLGIFFIAGLDTRVIYGGFVALLLGIIIVWNLPILHDYQKARITSVFNPEANPETGYHLKQSLIAIGSGGILGVRNPLSPDAPSGYASQYVPEVQTDFIFAAIGEQWGTLGAILLMTLYGILISKMVNIARTAKDKFGMVCCIGMASYFLFAIMQNIGMTIGVMPITGITLPLISYGGSSLLTTVISVGLILNIGMRRTKIYF